MHLLHFQWDDSLNGLSIRLEACLGRIPKYAILSHRWSANPADEVSFEDMILSPDAAKNKRGYKKIEGCCTQALRDGLSWAWIDTCCIDKRSSAELSEAINSMYNWYEKSNKCYAYLEDVCSLDGVKPLEDSSWFKRGWTLQELIAPAEIEFFSENWDKIGTKLELALTLANITKIAELALVEGIHVYKASVAEKMSWAANRETTREEDRAYSLLGIFGVNMPTLYGEGLGGFKRLQLEIMRMSNDHSMFAWERNTLTAGLLAESPDEFASSAKYHPVDYQEYVQTFAISNPKPDFANTNFGIYIQLPLAPVTFLEGYYDAFLACKYFYHRPDGQKERDEWVSIHLRRSPGGFPRQFMRASRNGSMLGIRNLAKKYDTEPIWVSLSEDVSPLLWKHSVGQISTYLRTPIPDPWGGCVVTIMMERSHRNISLLSAYPEEMFSNGNKISLKRFEPSRDSLVVVVVQNERGRNCMVFAFVAGREHLIIVHGATTETEKAEKLHQEFLSTGLYFDGGISAVPLNTTIKHSLTHGGISLTVQFVAHLLYRLILGSSNRHGDNDIEGGHCYINKPGLLSWTSLPTFLSKMQVEVHE